MDFASELQRIQRLLDQREYTPTATRYMIVTEQALRTIADRYLDQIDETVKQKIQAAVRKRGRRQTDQLTMGQLVRVFEEAEFLDACARTVGKNLSSLAVIDLKRLTDLRNKLIHNAQEASETEARFLGLGLKVLLETFDLSVPYTKRPDVEAADVLFRDGHALIIGMGADLPDTVNDAEGIANILRDAGRCAYPPEQVQVLTETQAARPHILAALDTLARSTDSESTVLIYFSGHGYQVSSDNVSRYYLDTAFDELLNLSKNLLDQNRFSTLSRPHQTYLSRIYYEFSVCFEKEHKLPQALRAIDHALQLAVLIEDNADNVRRLQDRQAMLKNRLQQEAQ